MGIRAGAYEGECEGAGDINPASFNLIQSILINHLTSIQSFLVISRYSLVCGAVRLLGLSGGL